MKHQRLFAFDMVCVVLVALLLVVAAKSGVRSAEHPGAAHVNLQ